MGIQRALEQCSQLGAQRTILWGSRGAIGGRSIGSRYTNELTATKR